MLHETVIVTFGLLVVIVAFAIIATWLRISYSILLVLGGIVLALIPSLPNVVLNPDLVLLLFLPPLIYASSWFIPWRDFVASLPLILLLAVGLVLVTMVAVAVVVHMLMPDLPWSVAFVLGVIVSPTDTVAATAIMKELGIGGRLTVIIEGESLMNDATALVAYRFAVGAVIGGSFSLWNAPLQFLLVCVGGIVIGLLLAFPLSWFYTKIQDPPSEIIISLLTPFAAYLIAEAFGASGVLAIVVAGLYMGHKSATFFSASTRLQSASFWNVLTFLANSLIFLLIGLELSTIIGTLGGRDLLPLIGYGLAVSITVILVRVFWTSIIYTIFSILRHIPWVWRNRFDRRTAFVVSWTGMRGGISLATALALPLTLPNNQPFPHRNTIIFVTFCVILVTLVLQGLTLNPLIRWLDIDSTPRRQYEIRESARQATLAAIEKLDELSQEDWVPRDSAQHMRAYYQRKLSLLEYHHEHEERRRFHEQRALLQRLRREIRDAERTRLLTLRDSGRINDEVFRRIERDLDLEEQRLENN